MRTWIDTAAADGSWLILTFHQFVSGTPTQSTEINLGNFEAILNYVQTKNLEPATLAEGVALMDELTGGSSGSTAVYDDAIGDGFFNASTAVDLSRYKPLSLWVHGGTSGGQIARVMLSDGSHVLGEHRLDQALGHAIQPGIWQQIVIPFSTLGVSTGTPRDVYLQDQSAGARAPSTSMTSSCSPETDKSPAHSADTQKRPASPPITPPLGLADTRGTNRGFEAVAAAASSTMIEWEIS